MNKSKIQRKETLFKLIGSLTTEEKSYFKKLMRVHSERDNQVVKLFDAINTQVSFNEASLRKMFPNYSVNKSNLFDEILFALSTLDRRKNIKSRVLSQQHVDIFYHLMERNLTEEALSQYDKAMSTFDALSDYTSPLLISRGQLVLLIQTHKQDIAFETIHDHELANQDMLDREGRVQKAQTQQFKAAWLANTSDAVIVKKYISKLDVKFLKQHYLSTDPRLAQICTQALSIYYKLMKRNTEFFKLMERNWQMSQQNPGRILNRDVFTHLGNVMYAAMIADKYDAALHYGRQLYGIRDKYPQYTSEIHLRYYALWLLTLIKKGELSAAYDFYLAEKDNMTYHAGKNKIVSYGVFLDMGILLTLFLGRHYTALQHRLQLIELSPIRTTQDSDMSIYMLELLLYVETGNKSGIKRYVKNIRRRFAHPEDPWLKRFLSIVTAGDFGTNKDVPVLIKDLKHLERTPLLKGVSIMSTFFLYEWLIAKSKQKTMAEYYKYN